jgi:hypothetical protein
MSDLTAALSTLPPTCNFSVVYEARYHTGAEVRYVHHCWLKRDHEGPHESEDGASWTTTPFGPRVGVE